MLSVGHPVGHPCVSVRYMFSFITKKIRQQRFISYFGKYIIKTCRLLFPVSVITFIVYFILENLKTGLISNYFDLNLLLVIAGINGLFLVLFNESDDRQHFRLSEFTIVLLAILAIILSYQYLQNLEKMRYLISLVIGIMLFIVLSLYAKNDH